MCLFTKAICRHACTRPTYDSFIQRNINLIYLRFYKFRAKLIYFFERGLIFLNKFSYLNTALSFKIDLKYPKDVYFIAKMPNFAHSDAEAPPSVFLYHMNKIF